ncbi:DUF4031 domain-containing protein [Cellulomonas sp. NPDC089187]|uniref:DUF4031 domain-containing protein n=1 Tax=Cellulomonas sp. NPDC089187 TaxID=3154970 RepID=UPI00344A0FBF
MILVDPPVWPAHDTLWSHLVSDTSVAELHAFAGALGIGRRAFDLDHYDIPAARHREVVEAGATPLSGGELTRRLIGSGLRVRGRDRPLLKGLRRRWLDRRPEDFTPVDDLLVRWREPHRTYHDARHLAECLTALDLLADRPELTRTAELALWFHDAVHDGSTPGDEQASAALAVEVLDDPRVAELILMTAHHDPDPADPVAALVSDADLAILGAEPKRYDEYRRQIRAEYATVPEEQFRVGRAAVLEQLLALPTLYRTERGRRLWAERAGANLRGELADLRP